MRPTKVVFDVGLDAYRRRTELIRERGSDGRETWTITRYAGDQRDDTERVSGLTAEQLETMAQATKEAP